VKQIAADYGLTAQQLNAILHEERVQYKVNDQWLLYREYLGMGYTKSESVPITRYNGQSDFKLHTRWTQKGRLFIHEMLTKRGIVAKMDIECRP
jgi:phage antirepressor YoqD-like protein